MHERLALTPPADLDGEQLRLYEEITGGPRAGSNQHVRLTADDGSLLGPFNAMLLQPSIGRELQALGAAVRYRGTLSDRSRELAILVVAAHWNSAFERYAHEALGRVAGLDEPMLAAIRDRTPVALADPAEAVVVQVSRDLVSHANLDDATFAEAATVLGKPSLFELVTLVGYYATLALQLRVFDADKPPAA